MPATAGSSAEAAGEEDPVGDGATPRPTQPRREVGGATDAAGDQGLEGPAYADLRSLTLTETREELEILVQVGGELPASLDDGEVLGLGIDLLRGDDGESSYQVFVDGGSDGWRAYFQTPAGFVAFPGTFQLGGDQLVLTVPWDVIGHPPEGPWSAFLDWSQKRLLLNAASADRLPDRGSEHFQR